jgi:hypothetical protein
MVGFTKLTGKSFFLTLLDSYDLKYSFKQSSYFFVSLVKLY